MPSPQTRSDGGRTDRIRTDEVMVRVQLPLENLQYALDFYLDENAEWLDPRTRELLVSVREGVNRIALSTHLLGCPPTCASDGPKVAPVDG